MGYCTTCGGYTAGDGHKCPPCWSVMIEDVGEVEPLYASTAELAAAKAVERYDLSDSGEMTERAIVIVSPSGCAHESVAVLVTGCVVRRYDGTEMRT